MTHHIEEILQAMREAGCEPRSSDIVINDKKTRFTPSDHNKPTGVYCFKHAENDIVIGWFRDYRSGEMHKYISTNRNEYTPEERAEFKKKIEKERRARRRRIEKERLDAENKANAIWENAQPVENHEYLQKKQIKPKSVRLYKGLLVIPARKEGKITSLQFIQSDSQKRMLKDGDISGAGGIIGTGASLIYVSEGWADAATINEATGKASAYAFNCGNMPEFCKRLKAKYPNSRIVICADNDQWTTLPDGTVNPGMTKAWLAALDIGADIIWPEFDAKGEKLTDFNDYMLLHGRESLKLRLSEAKSPALWGGNTGISFGRDVVVGSKGGIAPSPPQDWLDEQPPIEAYEDETKKSIALYESTTPEDVEESSTDWKADLTYDKHGNIHPTRLNNVRIMLEKSPRFKNLFCFNEFTQEKMVVQCPPWDNAKKFKPRPLKDEDVTWLAMRLEEHGITMQIGNIKKALDAVITKHKRNPAREYFKNLQWDGTPRLDTWLRDYLGARSEDSEYLAMVGRKWLTASVTRVFNPGAKFDHMLILDGPQGKGKSTALRELATIHGDEYFDDTVKANDLGMDRVVPKLQGVLIIEIQEMSGLSRVDMDNFKAQITVRDDRIVRKYQNEPVRLPRQFILAGTINPIEGYLDDPTGLRRFWPVQIKDDINMDRLKEDKEQLWAEAVHLYRSGEELFLPKVMQKKLDAVHASRKTVDPWQQDVEDIIGGRDYVTKRELWEGLGFEKSRKNSRDGKTIAKIMIGLGFEEKRARLGNAREYVWERIPDEEELPFD